MLGGGKTIRLGKSDTVDSTEQRNPIEILAEEFVQRHRRGEQPTVAEYVDTHPELADEIRGLFPTIVAMERLKKRKSHSGDRPIALHVDKLQQLGDYRIVREIGRGGMGIVYEAEQQSLGRSVAVKVFAQRALPDSKHLRRFQREARTAASLHHTNIVPVFGVGQQDDLHYYVMQVIDGISLDRVIAHLRESHINSAAPTVRVGANAGSWNSLTPVDSGHVGDGSPTVPQPSVGVPASAGLSPPEDGTPTGVSNRPRHKAAPAPLDDQPAEKFSARSDSSFDVAETVDQVHDPSADDLASHQIDPRRNLQGSRNYWQSVARIAIQAADALSYAHAQGTFHRDIKPSNLLLDARGTIWVTDFGLAKAVAQDNLSQSGDIVGTLRYMPPEQLRGTCDQRSDICSLGLTLYELLTLRPAFDDADPRRLIRRITQGAPTPPRKLRPEIPRDLDTIVVKAVAPDPNHRYQTAGELADDLRRFLEDRPIRARQVNVVERLARWSRRNPAVASLSAVLLIVVVAAFGAISWKWNEAEIEKHRALTENSRAQAENSRAETNLSLALDSMDQFLTRFTSTWMAHPTEPPDEEGTAEIEFHAAVSESTAAILQDALVFYDQFAEQNVGNPRLLRDTATAYRRVGEIHRRLGQYEKAEQAYRRAVGILEEQADEFPDDATLARDIAATLNDLGIASQTVRRGDEAKRCFDQAREILSNQLSRSPDSPDCRHELARTHNNLATMQWRMRGRDEASKNHRRALEILKGLVEEHPNNPAYRHAQAVAYRSYFPFGAFRAPREETRQFRAQAISLLENLVRDFPNVPDYQCELSEMLAMSSSRFGNEGTPEEAEAQLRRAVDLARQLKDQHPTIPRYRAALGRASQQLGTHLRETDRPTDAEPLHREAVELHETLVGEFPSIGAYQYYLSSAYESQLKTLRDLGRLPELRDAQRKVIARQEAYFQNRPDSFYAQRMLAWRYENLAETLKLLGEDEEAEKVSQKAKKLRDELRAKHPEFHKRKRRHHRSSASQES